MTYSAPHGDREAGPHWRAAGEGRLCLPFDAASGAPVWPPGAAETVWRACEGSGTILAISVVRRPAQPEWKPLAPYTVAMVRLDTGHRLFGNIVGCDPGRPRIGDRVKCQFVGTDEPSLGLVVFTL